MPIKPFLEGRVFEPDPLASMGEAFEITCDFLSLNPKKDDAATRRVASAIVQAAEAGHHSVEDLLNAAFRTLGIEKPEEPAA